MSASFPSPPSLPPPDPVPLIPDPAVILTRLSRVRIEARFLARLLRLSEDHTKALPRAATPPGFDERKGGGA